MQPRRGGYVLEAFLPAAAMHGYDPEQHTRPGFFYSVRDEELGADVFGAFSEIARPRYGLSLLM